MSGLEPGFQLGHYRILRSLGSGGMADVYEAHDDHLDRHVALKILPVEYSRNPQLVARFQKEVRAAAKLNHRNIVTVFEVGGQDSYHYFSMRLLTGGDLRGRIKRGLSPPEALAILRELADAFAHAHARGFVHRDVKPENVMFDEQGFPVLTDFGIAKALDADTRMTRTGMTMGTPRYLSPEQASGKAVDARADLYSLGVILYEMLTGRPPYDAEESVAVIFKHVTEPIPVLPPELLRFQPLLEKLMAKDPNQRLASADELVRAIDALGPLGRDPLPSQVRTAENPLVRGLLEPSPLRTPPPKTPRPLPTPAPAGDSGEVAVVARTATRDAAAARRAPPAAATDAAPREAAGGSDRRSGVAVAAVAFGVASLAVAVWVVMEGRSRPASPAAAAPETAPPPQVVASEPAPAPASAPTPAEPRRVEPARPPKPRAEQPRRDAEPAPTRAPAPAPEEKPAAAALAAPEWGTCRDPTLQGAQCATDAQGELLRLPAGYRSSRQYPDGDQTFAVVSGRLEILTSTDTFFFTQSSVTIVAGDSRLVPRSYRFLVAEVETVVRVRAAKPAGQ
jgi:tRNA A-37 threonylcarbamoyl transferase component Bud32